MCFFFHYCRLRPPHAHLHDRYRCLYLSPRPSPNHLRPLLLLLGWRPAFPLQQFSLHHIGIPRVRDPEYGGYVRDGQKCRCDGHRVHGGAVMRFCLDFYTGTILRLTLKGWNACGAAFLMIVVGWRRLALALALAFDVETEMRRCQYCSVLFCLRSWAGFFLSFWVWWEQVGAFGSFAFASYFILRLAGLLLIYLILPAVLCAITIFILIDRLFNSEWWSHAHSKILSGSNSFLFTITHKKYTEKPKSTK